MPKLAKLEIAEHIRLVHLKGANLTDMLINRRDNEKFNFEKYDKLLDLLAEKIIGWQLEVEKKLYIKYNLIDNNSQTEEL